MEEGGGVEETIGNAKGRWDADGQFHSGYRFAPVRDVWGEVVETPEQVEAALAKLQGSWKRVGYHAWDGEEYLEIPSGRDGVNETVETWMLRPNGRFKHVMGDNLWFTGRWNVEESFGLPTATSTRRWAWVL